MWGRSLVASLAYLTQQEVQRAPYFVADRLTERGTEFVGMGAG